MSGTGFSSGADTMSASEEKIGVQGNWVKKKDWVIKLNEANAEIQDLAVTISGHRKTFNNKFYTADGMLESFYKDLGQQQGKIAELFDNATRYLDKKKKKDIAQLTTQNDIQEQGQKREQLIKIEVVEQRINVLKNELEQLKLDMKSIEELGNSMDDRMKKVDEAIKMAIDEAASAQITTDESWQIIDDKKVRLKYYELHGRSLEKLKTIDGYLRNDLSKDFDDVINTIKTQIEKIQTSIKQLEEKGLIIKNRAHRIEELKLSQLKEFKDKQMAEEEELRRLATGKRTELAKPWYARWYNTFVNMIRTTIGYVTELFGGTSRTKTIAKTQPQESINPPSLPLPGSTTPEQLPSQQAQIPTLPPANPSPMTPIR